MTTTTRPLLPVVAPVAQADVVGTVHWVDGELVVRMRPTTDVAHHTGR